MHVAAHTLPPPAKERGKAYCWNERKGKWGGMTVSSLVLAQHWHADFKCTELLCSMSTWIYRVWVFVIRSAKVLTFLPLSKYSFPSNTYSFLFFSLFFSKWQALFCLLAFQFWHVLNLFLLNFQCMSRLFIA